MKVLSLGAARNIGYHASLSLLKAGHTVTFLLRNPSVFDGDAEIQPFIASSKAQIIKGDGTSLSDVQQAFKAAEPVDLVVFTIGMTDVKPTLKGFVSEHPNLVSQCLSNTVLSMPNSAKLVFVSAAGLTKDAYKNLPLPIRLLTSVILGVPHHDKRGAERLLSYSIHGETSPSTLNPSAGDIVWDSKDGEPLDDLLPNWRDLNLPKLNLESVVILRPAVLTDGPEKGVYRVQAGDVPSAWTISRKDVAHFIVGDLLANWSKYGGKWLGMAY